MTKYLLYQTVIIVLLLYVGLPILTAWFVSIVSASAAAIMHSVLMEVFNDDLF